MSIIVYIITIATISLCNINSIIFAQQEYAQITSIGAMLYKTETLENSFENIYFELENTYFVNIMYELNDCYRVNYNGIIGYASKNVVKRTMSIPQSPYPSNIKLTTNQNCYLRSNPSQSGNNQILTIAQNTTVDYIGTMHATSVTDFGDNTWYYIKYNSQYGYVHSGYFKSQAVVYPNTEEVSFSSQSPSVNPLSDTKIALLVTILTIPAIIIMMALYISPKVKHKASIKH